jgi:Protein of unknown function (DUF2878)
MVGQPLPVRATATGGVSVGVMPTLLNVAQFQVGWFACVLSAAAGHAWIGAAVAVNIVGIHLMRIENRFAELLLVIAAALVGLVADTMLIQSGWLTFAAGASAYGMTPYWMVTLWMIFATTLNHSLTWLHRNAVLAAVFGGLGGPLAYYAGERLGALRIADSFAAFGGIAIVWALALPLILWTARRLVARCSLAPVQE